jgi:endonuclease-3
VPFLKRRALAVHRRLLRAYGEPVWRVPLPPLDELVSTLLSQSTNDLNRDRAFTQLRARFPSPDGSGTSWEAVRDASLPAVVDAIRVAGLANQKAPRMQQVLRSITEERGRLDLGFLASLPAEEARAWLMKFKGVGPKTAAIVLQFSLGIPAFPVDTHIHRVSGRLGLRPPRASAEASHEILAGLFPASSYTTAHLNLIRHGREVCQARRPRCEVCVLTDLCEYYEKVVAPTRRRGASSSAAARRPVPKARGKKNRKRVSA